ncbi:MAG: hypothetical protein J6J57_07795, partial [Alistipes sp.]|nr:hypothetical protein [Alistipes sp.]
SYSISTSNHNSCNSDSCPMVVVSYSISTSNHNRATPIVVRWCCVLFYFYIKPQRRLSYAVISKKLHRFDD